MHTVRYRSLCLAIIGAAVTVPLGANAADIYRAPAPTTYAPPPPIVQPNTWAGFYVGVNGGYAWGAGDDDTMRGDVSGGFGGGQIGYNFQSGNFVYGLETDLQAGRITGKSDDYASKESTDWFGTLRGRLGYAFGNTLLYGTGGFAYGGVNQKLTYADVLFSNDDTRTGWTAGAGIEYKVSGNWSLKGEYQYVDFGKEDLSSAAGTIEGPETSFHTAKIGLNYRLGSSSSYEPLK
ncbi:porin [Rhodomicrobium udaipurense JA643]|uniref:Porin family protein n=1 Tax=Rhodomicrobium udaipurense TaxID=1202716 RepID=A0A8I1KL34_9HYPH|nr:outer membrane protein [Rhodomicrobium udaipurense]KAI96005.1 porin [Rhodomicrobium udaipurense JA643]MBJ7544946.1 porin family protein [Rhodomicrobium udaipurense]